MKIRVMVVEDSILQRAMIRSMLEKDEKKRFEVVASAYNGIDALEKLKRQKQEIDVITLDVEMPKMNGLETLRAIMKETPKPVVMFSSLTKKGTRETIQALEDGAVDFLTKPESGHVKDLGTELTEKIYMASKTKLPLKDKSPVTWHPSTPSKAIKKKTHGGHLTHLVLIGASTGGPRSLSTILSALPLGLSAGIVIAQHMQTGGFTASFANSLDKISSYRVKEAEDGDEVLDGHVYVAPAGKQTELTRKKGRVFLHVSDKLTDSRHKPSVDVLFQSGASVANHFPLFGVVLTGMGDDGCKGCQSLREKGCPILAESEKTAILFGMPKQVAVRGLADYVEDLQDVFPRIHHLIKTTP